MALLIFRFPQIHMSEVSGSFVCLAKQTSPFGTAGRPTAASLTAVNSETWPSRHLRLDSGEARGSWSPCRELRALRAFTVLCCGWPRARGLLRWRRLCLGEAGSSLCYKQEGWFARRWTKRPEERGHVAAPGLVRRCHTVSRAQMFSV